MTNCILIDNDLRKELDIELEAFDEKFTKHINNFIHRLHQLTL
jgi:hypothetical protein